MLIWTIEETLIDDAMHHVSDAQPQTDTAKVLRFLGVASMHGFSLQTHKQQTITKQPNNIRQPYNK